MQIFFRKIKEGIERRFNLNLEHALHSLKNLVMKPVPENLSWWNSFGIIIIILFVILIITGVLLSFYYKPTPEDAYVSIKYIMNQIPYGWLIRSIHHWSSNLLVIFLFAHFWRVFFTGAYKFPRELLYYSGLINMGVVFLFTFTGGLLPWNNVSYWTTSIMTSELKDLPLIGNYVNLFIRGGFDVGSGTLTRFFVAHIVLLPAIFTLILSLHAFMILYQGLSDWKSQKRQPNYNYAVLFIDISIILFGIFILLVTLSVFSPAPLMEVANPLRQPESVEPPWFMMPVFKIYKSLPANFLIFKRIEIFSVFLLIFFILLVVLPFIDKGIERSPFKRPVQSILGAIVIIISIFLIVSGFRH
jgi:quinol-cytochrome oxidoreductase complex cytochrome b subunit